MGSVFPAIEDRFKAVVLDSPGFFPAPSLPQVDQINFAPQVKAPVLMLNGRFDYYYPLQASQEPMFRLLGSPKDQKRHVVYETAMTFLEQESSKSRWTGWTNILVQSAKSTEFCLKQG